MMANNSSAAQKKFKLFAVIAHSPTEVIEV